MIKKETYRLQIISIRNKKKIENCVFLMLDFTFKFVLGTRIKQKSSSILNGH